ncbi:MULTISPECIES: hypothetical protein [Comamonas]|nr:MULTISPECIES: hypothetical protein [Comamonas]
MSRFAITHVDALHVRRRLVVNGAASRNAAMEFVEGLYGKDFWYLSCVGV